MNQFPPGKYSIRNHFIFLQKICEGIFNYVFFADVNDIDSVVVIGDKLLPVSLTPVIMSCPRIFKDSMTSAIIF